MKNTNRASENSVQLGLMFSRTPAPSDDEMGLSGEGARQLH